MENLNSPEPPKTIATLATIGRFGLAVTGILALIAVILKFEDGSTFTLLLGILGAVGMTATSVTGIFKPMRALDTVAVFLAASLAGALGLFAFNDFGGTDVLALLAWLFTLAFSGLIAVGLVYGPPVVSDDFSQQMGGLFTSPQPGTPPPGQYAPPTQQYAPPATQTYAPPAAPAPAEPAPQAPAPVEEPAAAEQAAPGWYPQEDGETARYWTGTEWSDDVKPISELS